MTDENKENGSPTVHTSQPGCSSTCKHMEVEMKFDQKDVKFIRKILGNIADEVIAEALQECPDLSDQLSNLFSLKFNSTGKRNVSDDICTIEKKRAMAGVEELKDTKELPANNSQTITRKPLEIRNDNLFNDSLPNRSTDNKNSIERSPNQNTEVTVTKAVGSDIQTASRENAVIRAESAAEVTENSTGSTKESRELASVVSENQSSKQKSIEGQGHITNLQATTSQQLSRKAELIENDGVTQKVEINTRKVPHVTSATVGDKNQVMPMFVARTLDICVQKMPHNGHSSAVLQSHAASSPKETEIVKREVHKTLPMLVNSSGPHRQQVGQPVLQTASKKISVTQNRPPPTTSTTNSTEFQRGNVPVAVGRSLQPNMTTLMLDELDKAHNLAGALKAPEVMVTSTKPPIMCVSTQQFPQFANPPRVKHQTVSTVTQQQQVAELSPLLPPRHSGQLQPTGSQASAGGWRSEAAAKTLIVTQSNSVPKPSSVQKVSSAKQMPVPLPAPRRQFAVPLMKNQVVQQVTAQTKVVDHPPGVPSRSQRVQQVVVNVAVPQRPPKPTKTPTISTQQPVQSPTQQQNTHPPVVPPRSQRVQKTVVNVAVPQRPPRPTERLSISTQQPVQYVQQPTQQQSTQPSGENEEDAQQNVEVPRVPPPNDNYCEEIYENLRLIFPNIDGEFLTRFCPSKWSDEVTHDEHLGRIIDTLLKFEGKWEMAVKVQPSVDETYERLLEVLPNADPTYLHTMAEQLHADEKALENFVETALESQNYPTRDQYLSKMRITEEQLRYTKNFTVAKFLEKFPDPFTHFMNKSRRCNLSAIGLEFLKSIFNTHRVSTVSRVYKRVNYNLSVAAHELRRIPSDMVTNRRSTEVPTEDINMLQEMAFIRHRVKIKGYIDCMKAAEKAEFEQLKKINGLLECQCCYDSECMPSKCATCDRGHVFCYSCITKGTDSRLGEGETHVPCFIACGSEFSLATLQKILKPTKFSILVKKRQAAEVAAAGLEGLVACPFCHFASIPPEGDKIFKCLNPDCMKESCILCKEPNHVPLRCNEVAKTEKARKYMEEKMTEALARKCYNCKRAYFKEEGCNKITCLCGAMMCYLCDKKISDYSHFRGQGSDDMTKCPLYSDDARLNAQTVRRVAAKVKEELLRQDPTLNIDTTGLLPELPAPRAGPHQQIVQAPEMAAAYAARVLQDVHRGAAAVRNVTPN